jgi:hypothetical protein
MDIIEIISTTFLANGTTSGKLYINPLVTLGNYTNIFTQYSVHLNHSKAW